MKVLFLLLIITTLHASAEVTNQLKVIVNGEALSAKTIQQLENFYHVKIKPGRYWYDKISGFWGMEGQIPSGIMMANLELGGKLQENASAGNTGIYVNGREINQLEKAELIKITGTMVQPGRYWLDAQGWTGFEGQGALTNIFYLSNQYYSRRSGNSFYRNSYTDMGMGGNSEGFYIMGEDFSYSQF